MDPITIGVAIWALAALGALTWESISNWIDSRKVPSGTATVLRSKLASGEFRVVTGVFSPSGTKIAEKIWTGKTLAPALDKRFGDDNIIKITT